MGNSLDKAGIVVTRPAERGESLCRAIAAEGGRALAFPTLEIQPLERIEVDLVPGPVDWLVFTSVAAVEHAAGGLARYPASRVAAIGAATAEALDRAGYAEVVLPEGRQESEGLLALPEFESLPGRRVLLVKGVGGRALLREALEERGADVGEALAYRRVRPEQDTRLLSDWWQDEALDAVVVSSREGMENLWQMLDAEGRKLLAGTTVVAPTSRMIKLLQELGIHAPPVIAEGASDEALLQALQHWWKARQESRKQDRS